MKIAENQYKRIRKSLAVTATRTLQYLCRILGSSGTTIPGVVAMMIDSELLAELASELRVIVITGTNGKTTAVHMAAHMLHSMKIPCAYSYAGGNMESSILTVLIENYDSRKKRPVNDTAILECDEKYAVKLLKALNPVCITVTGICKDQPDRLGQPEDVVEMFLQGFSDYRGTICINTADKYSNLLAEKVKNEQMIQYSGRENYSIIQDKSYPVKLSIPGKYNINNAAAAMASLYAAGFSIETAGDLLQSLPPVFGRMERLCIGSTPVITNLSKNPSGVYESLKYIEEELGISRVVLGFNNDSGDGKDLSWLREVPWKDYEKCFSEVIVFTDMSDETEQILHSLEIPFRSTNSTGQLLKLIKESSEPVFMILNYTCMMKVRKRMVRKRYVPDYGKFRKK